MTTPTHVIRAFYRALSGGDVTGAIRLMADNIEWTTMWHYKVDGPGPTKVVEGLLMPLMAEWSSFALTPTDYFTEGDNVVSIGSFKGVHGASGKAVDAGYAHVWTVQNGKIARFRQYIDTLAVAEARR